MRRMADLDTVRAALRRGIQEAFTTESPDNPPSPTHERILKSKRCPQKVEKDWNKQEFADLPRPGERITESRGNSIASGTGGNNGRKVDTGEVPIMFHQRRKNHNSYDAVGLLLQRKIINGIIPPSNTLSTDIYVPTLRPGIPKRNDKRPRRNKPERIKVSTPESRLSSNHNEIGRKVRDTEVDIIFPNREKFRRTDANEILMQRKLQNGIISISNGLKMTSGAKSSRYAAGRIEDAIPFNPFGPHVHVRRKALNRKESGNDEKANKAASVWGIKLPTEIEASHEEHAQIRADKNTSDEFPFNDPIIAPEPNRLDLPTLNIFPGRLEQRLRTKREKHLQWLYAKLGRNDRFKGGINVHRGNQPDIRKFVKFETPDHLKSRPAIDIKIDTDGEKNSLYLYVIQELVNITQGFSGGHYDEAIEGGKILMQVVTEADEEAVPKHWEIISTICSIVGNSYLELDNPKVAAAFHKQDLRLGQAYKLEEATSRALENLGRTYAKMGLYNKAINVWQLNVPIPGKQSEKAWLCHEIGSCYMETESYGEAIDYGEASLMLAIKADDPKWQLNANVLIAQASLRSGDITRAYEHFQRGYDLAMKTGDNEAVENIKGALDEVREAVKEMNDS